ncbi:DUF1549 and DUF1553 domain-containing protein [Zavarzinella formosa]|uniref:DUF1549 and DUF1553 domain-containing protein n=1 Tax=Zavarzinella formosa TaxID=360055 RepID=UPI000306B72E|nr:DUF1549 and DUF1553 domain-containing protein [Zavarzinella formosa]
MNIRLLLPLFLATPAVGAEPIAFRDQVMAAFSRAGCNSGACHGSPQGKNGFRLSLRGFDPDQDFALLVKEQGGRRVNRTDPDASLILEKGAGRVRHGGGALFSPSDPAYQTIREWIAQGAVDSPNPVIRKLEITAEGTGNARQITAKVIHQDGHAAIVNPLAVFTTTDAEVASVNNLGQVNFKQNGEVVVLVRYLEQIASIRLASQPTETGFKFTGPAPANFIDEEVFAKQREFHRNPLPVCADEVFLRRVFLDLTGTLPSADEARAFLDSTDPKKRAVLIDSLLDREEYAQFWAMKWADVLRGNPSSISDRGVHSFHRYLVRTVAADRPMTEFARDLLTGQGNTLNNPAANFYRIARTPEEAAESAAQLFMGVRVQCAKCHNHPFESITQTDYYGLAAFFARVQFKGTSFGLDDEIVYLTNNRDVQHPRTRKTQPPVAFGVQPTMNSEDDRREKFADWLTAKDNRFFAPSLVNRVWYHLIGRGLVDPVDDFRDTNPPSHPKLLERLAAEFAANGYRMKPLIRQILNSKTYQLAGLSPGQTPELAKADRYFTRSAVRMLSAEQILDAVSRATGVPEKFKGFPLGTKAIELPEGGINHPFLQAFSKPVRDVTCECAREEDPSLPQVMQLLNNDSLIEKIHSPKGRIAAWAKAGKSSEWMVEQIYLGTLSRRPTTKEREIIGKHLATIPDKTAGLHDLQHALLNVNEFVLRH